jgi:hypothetical protein
MEEMRQAKFHNSHPHGTTAPRGPGPPYYRCCTITVRHTIFDRTPLDEGSTPRTDVYLKHTTLTTDTHACRRRDSNTQSQQTHALDRTATGIGSQLNLILRVTNFTINITIRMKYVTPEHTTVIIVGSAALVGPWPSQAIIASDLCPGQPSASFDNPVSLRLPLPRQSVLISVVHVLVGLQGLPIISFFS